MAKLNLPDGWFFDGWYDGVLPHLNRMHVHKVFHFPQSDMIRIELHAGSNEKLEEMAHDMDLKMDLKTPDLSKLNGMDLLRHLLVQNHVLNDSINSVQKRSSELITKARDWRKKIIAMGGEDPGIP